MRKEKTESLTLTYAHLPTLCSSEFIFPQVLRCHSTASRPQMGMIGIAPFVTYVSGHLKKTQNHIPPVKSRPVFYSNYIYPLA